MSLITTHVLDTSLGQPARGIQVHLEYLALPTGWRLLATGKTDADGRIGDLLSPSTELAVGDYRLTFATGDYFTEQKIDGFYPTVTITFTIRHLTEHYHVPLLLNPYGYSTYRGS